MTKKKDNINKFCSRERYNKIQKISNVVNIISFFNKQRKLKKKKMFAIFNNKIHQKINYSIYETLIIIERKKKKLVNSDYNQ